MSDNIQMIIYFEQVHFSYSQAFCFYFITEVLGKQSEPKLSSESILSIMETNGF